MNIGEIGTNERTDCDVIVAGHSHMFAMGAQKQYQGPVGLVPFSGTGRDGYFLMEEWKTSRSDEYWDALVNLSANRGVLIVFSGNQHYADFLLAAESPFDFMDDKDSDLQPDAVVVPRRLIRAYFEPTVFQLRSVLGRLQTSGCRCVGVLGTPPPKADVVKFTDLIRRATFFTRFAQRRGINLHTVNMTPAAILLKMWRVIQDLMEEAARDCGAVFIPVPSEAMDSSGFLDRKFYGYTEGDITHANAQYGRLMLEHALRHLPRVLQ